MGSTLLDAMTDGGLSCVAWQARPALTLSATGKLMTDIRTLASLLGLFSAVNLQAAATLTNSLSANGNLAIGWGSRGSLEIADQMAGPWTTITNPPNPYTAPISNGAK